LSETDLVSTEATPETAGAPARRRGGLTGMVLAELRQLAGELNIPDTSGMRKGDLIAAIKARQGDAAGSTSARSRRAGNGATAVNGAGPGGAEPAAAITPAAAAVPADAPTAVGPATVGSAAPAQAAAPADTATTVAADTPPAGSPDEMPADGPSEGGRRRQARARNRVERTDRPEQPEGQPTAVSASPEGGDVDRTPREGRRNRGDRPDNRGGDRGPRDRGANDRDRGPDNRGGTDTRDTRDNRDAQDDTEDDGDGRGRRGRRFRDRRRGRDRSAGGSGGGSGGGQGGRDSVDTEVREGDVLLPVAGIVDILDNYAFVRTTGYLSGPTDVYVSLSVVRRYGLRRGDAITGAVREARDGEQSRQKFNPLVRVDTINGQDPETTRSRPEFTKLTPLYPNDRLRLETDSHRLTTRVIDLVMPVGKGQRALIVSPPKAGKTTIMQNIANAITTNNPECHLMVVLVDERPEEVTDMQRSVKGEVIASTFDRPPTDHTTVAELSIERAKRLVEMGHDVVVLLDNITRLGRAYNLAAPASGRILSGGVDSTALYPPKRFLGAARNIEDGGSLTIFATALVETGSTMDTVIFEEFKGTGNAELKLDRRIADKRVFPAIDVSDSGTRKDELLLSPDEHAVTVKLRRVLSGLDDQQAIDLLLTQLRKTRTNIEFLMQVAKNTPGTDD